MNDTDAWVIIPLELAGDNPAEAVRIREACSYYDISQAWLNSRRKMEGLGYKMKERRK